MRVWTLQGTLHTGASHNPLHTYVLDAGMRHRPDRTTAPAWCATHVRRKPGGAALTRLPDSSLAAGAAAHGLYGGGGWRWTAEELNRARVRVMKLCA